jgi:hypothetical protein
MTTRFLDLNASNAIQINETNNRYKIQLNETLELPTGTQISVQNSLINLQGITGQSIELEKDFEETIYFNYYAIDTSYPTPVAKVGDPSKLSNFDIYIDMAGRFNGELGFYPNGGGITDQAKLAAFYAGTFGFTENIMPLVGVKQFTRDGVNKNFLIPMCGKALIKVKKGIYSVESLADLITDQINRVTSPNDIGFGEDQTNYDYKRTAGSYRGLAANYTTCRPVQTPNITQWINFKDGVALFSKDLPDFRALDQDDTDLYAAYAIKPNDFNTILEAAKGYTYLNRDDFDENSNPLNEWESFKDGGGAIKYGYTFVAQNGDVEGDPAQLDFKNYNVFNNGYQVGTSGMKLIYDSQASAFSFQYLHEPRRIPTNDRRGNQLSNPSQECCYLKRIYNMYDSVLQAPVYDFFTGADTEAKKNFYSTLNAVMMRTGGIQIYNWAGTTARAEGNQNNLGINVEDDTEEARKDFWNFNDFFTTTKLAKKAWEKTLWFRLGFSYEQLQNSQEYEINRWYDQNYSVQGTTTQANVDQTLIPFVSSIYNDYGYAAEQKPEGDQFQALPALNSVQLFNMLDCNVPTNIYNNNKSGGAKYPNDTVKEVCVAPYMGSFYDNAVCIPVQTTGNVLSAKSLPRLSVNGYMLVLSDLVNQQDQAGQLSEVGILDLIPKSSLSNQDFIATINEMTHILSNPKVVNSIDLNILNPDLTDIELEPNSTILLKIVTPTPRPTELLAEAKEQISENEIRQEVAQEIQKEQKMDKKNK